MSNQIGEKILVEAGTEVVKALAMPTANSIGDNLGCFFDGLTSSFAYLGKKWKIYYEMKYEEYKKDICKNLQDIPQKNLKEPNLSIVGPALEASKYYINEEELKTMFINLITSTCDKTKDSFTHTYFTEAIKQMSVKDAKIMNAFRDDSTFPFAYVNIRKNNGIVTPLLEPLIDFFDKISAEDSDMFCLNSSLENLSRLGLIKLNYDLLKSDYDYNKLKQTMKYRAYKSTAQNESDLVMKMGRIELTSLGIDFVRCCI